MLPEKTRVLRRERRKAWRGFPRGRRATHEVETTYGRHQRQRDWLEAFNAGYRAAMAVDLPGETDDGTTACTDTSAPYVAHKPKEG